MNEVYKLLRARLSKEYVDDKVNSNCSDMFNVCCMINYFQLNWWAQRREKVCEWALDLQLNYNLFKIKQLKLVFEFMMTSEAYYLKREKKILYTLSPGNMRQGEVTALAMILNYQVSIATFPYQFSKRRGNSHDYAVGPQKTRTRVN